MAASPPPVGIRRDRFLFPTKEQDNGPLSSTPTVTSASNINSNHTLASLAATSVRDSPLVVRESPAVSVFRNDRRKISEPETSLRAGLGMAHKTLTAPVSSPPKFNRKEAKEASVDKTVSNTVDSAVPLRSRIRGSSVGRFEMGRTTPQTIGDRNSVHGDTISLGGASCYPLAGIGAQNWRDKPVNMGKYSLGANNKTSFDIATSRSGCKALDNGSVGPAGEHTDNSLDVDKASTCGSDGISDCVSEPGGVTGWSVRHYNSGLTNEDFAQRAITPPPKALPPRGVHSDMYNTVFALQALNCDGWSDYLTRVRGLWDGHMNNKSPTPTPHVPAASETVPEEGSTPKVPSEEGGEGDGGSAKGVVVSEPTESGEVAEGVEVPFASSDHRRSSGTANHFTHHRQ